MKKRIDETKPSTDAAPETAIDGVSLDTCYGRIREILQSAATSVARSVNTAQVVSYWLIGREIVEEEQRGSRRAEYGQRLLGHLSVRMQAEFGRGRPAAAAPNWLHSVEPIWPGFTGREES